MVPAGVKQAAAAATPAGPHARRHRGTIKPRHGPVAASADAQCASLAGGRPVSDGGARRGLKGGGVQVRGLRSANPPGRVSMGRRKPWKSPSTSSCAAAPGIRGSL